MLALLVVLAKVEASEEAAFAILLILLVVILVLVIKFALFMIFSGNSNSVDNNGRCSGHDAVNIIIVGSINVIQKTI